MGNVIISESTPNVLPYSDLFFERGFSPLVLHCKLLLVQISEWTLSAMKSKHKMAADCVGTFVQRVLGEMVVRYVNVYMLQQGAR